MKKRHPKTRRPARSKRSAAGETSNTRDEIIDWLKDAYGLERGLESSLEKQSAAEDVSPGIRERVSAHLEETRRHAEAVRAALQSLGADISSLKTGIGRVAQAAKGMGSKFARDERIKDLLDAYSMEHFEIACYTALEAAAQREGLVDVAETCRRIIPDEKRMAEALLQALPDEVTSYLFETEIEERESEA